MAALDIDRGLDSERDLSGDPRPERTCAGSYSSEEL